MKWEGNPEMDKMAELMTACLADPKRPDNIMFLDLETSLNEGKTCEIAICNAFGRRILECHPSMTPDEENKLKGLFWRSERSSALSKYVFRASNQRKLGHTCSDGFLDDHQVAKQLRKHGISPRSTFVAWAKTKLDLTLVRAWLEAGGYDDILPEGKNCILLPLFAFRHNFDRLGIKVAGKQVPCKLELVFPAIFGVDHHLAFKNHSALIDTFQLWLLTKVLLELLKHPSQRSPNWLKNLAKKRMIDGPLQTSLEKYRQSKPGAEVDKEA